MGFSPFSVTLLSRHLTSRHVNSSVVPATAANFYILLTPVATEGSTPGGSVMWAKGNSPCAGMGMDWVGGGGVLVSGVVGLGVHWFGSVLVCECAGLVGSWFWGSFFVFVLLLFWGVGVGVVGLGVRLSGSVFVWEWVAL